MLNMLTMNRSMLEAYRVNHASSKRIKGFEGREIGPCVSDALLSKRSQGCDKLSLLTFDIRTTRFGDRMQDALMVFGSNGPIKPGAVGEDQLLALNKAHRSLGDLVAFHDQPRNAI